MVLSVALLQQEVLAKDEPQNIHDAILSYVLQLSRDGNFQTRQSDSSEVF